MLPLLIKAHVTHLKTTANSLNSTLKKNYSILSIFQFVEIVILCRFLSSIILVRFQLFNSNFGGLDRVCNISLNDNWQNFVNGIEMQRRW